MDLLNNVDEINTQILVEIISIMLGKLVVFHSPDLIKQSLVEQFSSRVIPKLFIKVHPSHLLCSFSGLLFQVVYRLGKAAIILLSPPR